MLSRHRASLGGLPRLCRGASSALARALDRARAPRRRTPKDRLAADAAPDTAGGMLLPDLVRIRRAWAVVLGRVHKGHLPRSWPSPLESGLTRRTRIPSSALLTASCTTMAFSFPTKRGMSPKANTGRRRLHEDPCPRCGGACACVCASTVCLPHAPCKLLLCVCARVVCACVRERPCVP